MSLSISVKGSKEMRAKLDALMREVPQVVGAALYQEAQNIKTQSQDQAPVDLKTLKDSAFVNEPEYHVGGNITVTVGYGGAAAAYAMVQHEDLWWDKKLGKLVSRVLHHDDGNAKFLEKPLLAAEAGLAARLARRIKASLRT